MGLTEKAALSGVVAIGLCVAGSQTLGLLAGGVFMSFAAPWYYRLFRSALGYNVDFD